MLSYYNVNVYILCLPNFIYEIEIDDGNDDADDEDDDDDNTDYTGEHWRLSC